MNILNLFKSWIMNLRLTSALVFMGGICVLNTIFPSIANIVTLTVVFVLYFFVEMYLALVKAYANKYRKSVNKNVKTQKVFILFSDKTKKSYVLDGSVKNTAIRKFKTPQSYKAAVLVDTSYFTKGNVPYDDVFVREQRQYFRKVMKAKEGTK